MKRIVKNSCLFLTLLTVIWGVDVNAGEKNVAVILSGCGVYDGSEILESVFTLLAIDKLGARAVCFAPDKEQLHVVNHLTGKPEKDEKRNVLKEAARIARGDIKPLAQLDINKIDALILPGGYGAAKNLCDYALKGAECSVDEQLVKVLKDAHAAGKPLGFICIAPTIAAKVFGPEKVRLTIGNDPDTAASLEKMGAKHITCPASKAYIDEERKIISTPAFMTGKGLQEVAMGIEDMVNKTLKACD